MGEEDDVEKLGEKKVIQQKNMGKQEKNKMERGQIQGKEK